MSKKISEYFKVNPKIENSANCDNKSSMTLKIKLVKIRNFHLTNQRKAELN